MSLTALRCPRCGGTNVCKDLDAVWCLACGSSDGPVRVWEVLMEPADGRFATEQGAYEDWDEGEEQMEMPLDALMKGVA